jgi:alpha-glucosidase
MKKKFLIVLLGCLIMSGCSHGPANQWSVSSPDNRLHAVVTTDANGRLFYYLESDNGRIVDKSPAGMLFEETSFGEGLIFKSLKRLSDQEDAYTMLTGKRKENHALWNELILGFENPDGQLMYMNLRIFNDGFAFNYEFPGQGEDSWTLKGELTGFNIPGNSKAWKQAYDTVFQWAPAYETFFENGIPAGSPSPWNKNGWSFPMLFKTGNDWVLITDAGMDEGYCGMRVDGNPVNNLYTLLLPPEEEAMGLCPSSPSLSLPIKMPWKVVITGDSPGTIVESNLVYHLSKPDMLADNSWIRPGRSAWSWWAESDSPRDFNRLKEYVDFTALMGWEYFLVDANWNIMEGGTLKQLAEYANSRGVGITAWYNTGGPNNVVTEMPRDLMHLSKVRREEFKKISQWGIKGVKVDFFQSDKSCILQLYHDILKDAADFGLLANFHGSTIPRGWERTYPNLMTMESVRGAECYKFATGYAEYAPVHRTILPFTRNVLGSMDYTPVTFSNSTFPKISTHAHELALAVVFESGLQHFADSDNSYLSQPGYVIDYLKKVPATWDDTRFDCGYPGEFVVIARKKGDKWFVSGINGLDTGKSVDAGLDFLSPGSYRVDIIFDGENQDTFSFETLTLDAGAPLKVGMAARGGFAAVISPE